jgi:hypothetical protein
VVAVYSESEGGTPSTLSVNTEGTSEKFSGSPTQGEFGGHGKRLPT